MNDGKNPGTSTNLVSATAEIVATYVGANSIAANAVPDLISTVHAALTKLGTTQAAPLAKSASAAVIKKSIRPEAIISFLDNKPYRTLRRHLSANNMTPEEYRTKFGLPDEYPMIAPDYSAARSQMALAHNFGRRAKPEPTPVPEGAAPEVRRSRASQPT